MWWFFRKRDDENWNSLHSSLKSSFSGIKEDVGKIHEWIKHLEGHRTDHHSKIDGLTRRIEQIEEVLFAQKQTDVRFKQTAVHVQTAVQTAFEANLMNLSMMERDIIWTLLNTDLELSYDDLAVELGKNKSTVRGQINSIKQKSEGLIRENIENNGRKRFSVNEEIKVKLLKQMKEANKASKRGRK